MKKEGLFFMDNMMRESVCVCERERSFCLFKECMTQKGIIKVYFWFFYIAMESVVFIHNRAIFLLKGKQEQTFGCVTELGVLVYRSII